MIGALTLRTVGKGKRKKVVSNKEEERWPIEDDDNDDDDGMLPWEGENSPQQPLGHDRRQDVAKWE